jgi:hypothetical protein
MAFQLVKEVYANQSYRGKAEKCNYTFTVNLPDQMGSSWYAEDHVNAIIQSLADEDSILLEYRLWEDKMSGTWTTDYKCEVVASASPLWWNLIILAAFALISLIVVAYILNKVVNISEYMGGAAGPTFLIGALALLAFGAALLLKEIKKPSQKYLTS